MHSLQNRNRTVLIIREVRQLHAWWGVLVMAAFGWAGVVLVWAVAVDVTRKQAFPAQPAQDWLCSPAIATVILLSLTAPLRRTRGLRPWGYLLVAVMLLVAALNAACLWFAPMVGTGLPQATALLAGLRTQQHEALMFGIGLLAAIGLMVVDWLLLAHWERTRDVPAALSGRAHLRRWLGWWWAITSASAMVHADAEGWLQALRRSAEAKRWRAVVEGFLGARLVCADWPEAAEALDLALAAAHELDGEPGPQALLQHTARVYPRSALARLAQERLRAPTGT